MNQKVGCYSSEAFQGVLGRCLFLETGTHCPVPGQRCRNPGPATGFTMNSTVTLSQCLPSSVCSTRERILGVRMLAWDVWVMDVIE